MIPLYDCISTIHSPEIMFALATKAKEGIERSHRTDVVLKKPYFYKKSKLFCEVITLQMYMDDH